MRHRKGRCHQRDGQRPHQDASMVASIVGSNKTDCFDQKGPFLVKTIGFVASNNGSNHGSILMRSLAIALVATTLSMAHCCRPHASFSSGKPFVFERHASFSSGTLRFQNSRFRWRTDCRPHASFAMGTDPDPRPAGRPAGRPCHRVTLCHARVDGGQGS